MTAQRTLILGTAARCFHHFNKAYRDDPGVEMVAFIASHSFERIAAYYPPALAGPLYPNGIAILDQNKLDAFLQDRSIDQVVFAESDITYAHLMHTASRVLSAGASFVLPGPRQTMLRAKIPVITVSAVRAGCGKSQTVRYLSRRLSERGLSVAVVVSTTDYRDIEGQQAQRFVTAADLSAAECTLEEREQYEPHIAAGHTLYRGIDYARMLAFAEQGADLLLCDGFSNDFPFLQPDLHIVLVDCLRPSQVDTHYPGETLLRMADAVVLARSDTATIAQVDEATVCARHINPHAPFIRGASPAWLDDAHSVRGRKVLVVEDGSTLIHSGMYWGAGCAAARKAGAAGIGPVLMLRGDSPQERATLTLAIDGADAAIVVSATPHDLAAALPLTKPVVRARHEFRETGEPGLWSYVEHFLNEREL